MLKFLQNLTLFFPGLSYRKTCRKFSKVVLGLLPHVTPSIFSRRILSCEAVVYNSYIFFTSAVLRKLFNIKFISHINTVISYAFAYSSRWRAKAVTRSVFFWFSPRS